MGYRVNKKEDKTIMLALAKHFMPYYCKVRPPQLWMKIVFVLVELPSNIFFDFLILYGFYSFFWM